MTGRRGGRERNEHCVLRDEGATAFCMHCGGTARYELPMELSKYSEEILGFCEVHKACKPGDPELTSKVNTA